MRYCKKCIMPDTRPDQYLNEDGICNACLGFEYQKIDWEKANQLNEIIKKKNLNKDGWNCVVPGKWWKR